MVPFKPFVFIQVHLTNSPHRQVFVVVVFKILEHCPQVLPSSLAFHRSAGECTKRSLSKTRRRRRRQRQGHQTKGLMSKTIAVHVRFESLYISLPFSTNQQRELRACLHGGGGPQVGEVTRLAVVEKCLAFTCKLTTPGSRGWRY